MYIPTRDLAITSSPDSCVLKDRLKESLVGRLFVTVQNPFQSSKHSSNLANTNEPAQGSIHLPRNLKILTCTTWVTSTQLQLAFKKPIAKAHAAGELGVTRLSDGSLEKNPSGIWRNPTPHELHRTKHYSCQRNERLPKFHQLKEEMAGLSYPRQRQPESSEKKINWSH